MLLSIYQSLSYCLYPFIKLILWKRKLNNKENLARFNERLGISSTPRPEGKLIWMHGASVGESISMLPLIEKIGKEHPLTKIMVTTGTVTSAKLLSERLPKNAFHQFIPVDLPTYTKRFVEHWHPSLVLWFESEFWPNIINDIAKKNIPLILLNGRVSDKSFGWWKIFKPFISAILSKFTLCLGQTKTDAARLQILGAKETACEGNIKFAAPPLPFNVLKLAELVGQTRGRTIILASSTHPKEDGYIGCAHIELKKDFSNLLSIIVPRHPQRGAAIKEELEAMGLKTAQRSKSEAITEHTDIYIADTIGELGIFYRLCEVVFIGGSLIAHGGQNFLEAFRLNTAVITGKHMHNFTEMTKLALEKEALIQINGPQDLAKAFSYILSDKEAKLGLINKSFAMAENESLVLEKIYAKLKSYL